jgi:tetratricopeptide (TPR) repeat protein
MLKLVSTLLIVALGVWAASPDQFVKEGIALRDAGDFNEAIVKFSEAIKVKQKYAAAHYELGRTYIMMKQYDKAIQSLSDAINYGYDKLRTHLALAQAYRGCNLGFEAVMEYQLALQISPNDPAVHTLLGDSYAERGNETLAMEEYEAALAIDPQYIPALVGLGAVYQSEREYEDAQTYYAKAKALDPKYEPVYLSLGSLYAMQKEYENGIAEVMTYTKLKPQDPAGYLALADIHIKMQDYGSAMNDMLEARARGDTTLSSLQVMRFLYSQEARTTDEKDIIKEILVKTPSDVNLWLDLAKTYSKIDSFPGTVYAYQQAISLDSATLKSVVFELALAYYQVAKYDSSEQMFSIKLQHDSLAAGAYLNRALARMQLKKYKDAATDLETGLRLRPDHLQGHLWLAQLYAFMGMNQKAKTEYNAVLKLDPKNKDAKEGLTNLSKPAPQQQDYWDYYDDEEEYNQ